MNRYHFLDTHPTPPELYIIEAHDLQQAWWTFARWAAGNFGLAEATPEYVRHYFGDSVSLVKDPLIVKSKY